MPDPQKGSLTGSHCHSHSQGEEKEGQALPGVSGRKPRIISAQQAGKNVRAETGPPGQEWGWQWSQEASMIC